MENVFFPAGKVLFQLKPDALHLLTGISVSDVDYAVRAVLPDAFNSLEERVITVKFILEKVIK